VHPVFDPYLGCGEVRRLLRLLPRRAQGPHHIVKHDPLHRPIARNGRKLSDQPTNEQIAFECVGLAVANAKAAELRMGGYRDVNCR
jgi:hypothetical protein